jgi:hypothetical protein
MATGALLTAEGHVASAMRALGALAAGENPTAEDTQDGVQELQWMLKSWQVRGVTSWRQTDTTATFGAGVASVDLPQGIADVAGVRIGTTSSRPLFRIERARYLDLPNKAQSGIPTLYTSHEGVSQVTLTVWPVPTVSTVLYLDAVRTIDDVVNTDDVLDVPQKWTECVSVSLAVRMAPMLGAMRLDPNSVNLVMQRAETLQQALFDSDRTSIYMGA